MQKPPYRTIVYIDGFNFYYGEIRGTPWKWLDPYKLFQNILGSSNTLLISSEGAWRDSRLVITALDFL